MQPTPYTRFQNHSDYQAGHPLPGPALSGPSLDTEFDRIKTTLDQILNNIALIQRDDGKLRNTSVSPDTITSALAIMIAGWAIRGPWVTAAVYAVKDYVTQGGNGYVCLVAHAAGTFNTDLAAGKWSLVQTKGDTGANGTPGIQGVPGTPGLTSTITNRLVNGDFAIDQRNAGAAQTFTAAANVAYCVDRWYASCTGANVTGRRVVGTAPNQFAYQFTGATSNTAIVFGQRIEAANVADLVNGNVTVQVWLSSSSITSVTWKAFYANTADAFGTKSTTGTGTITQIATGSIAITSTPTLYTFTFNAGANAGRGIDLEFSTGALGNAQSLKFEAAGFERGSLANTFERLPMAVRLAMCQRYYEKSYDQGTALGTVTNVGSAGATSTASGSYFARYSFRVTKRVAPTMVAYNPVNGASGSWRDIGAAGNGAPSMNAGDSTFTVSNSLSASSVFYGHYTADAEL